MSSVEGTNMLKRLEHLSWEAEGLGLVQAGAEKALGKPDSSLAKHAWRLLRRWSQGLY